MTLILKNNLNDFTLGVLALYLPPDNYIYGRDSEGFFTNASALYEDLSGCDLVVGGGDLNARTKDIIDFDPDVDGDIIPKRHNPDRTKNKHADDFILFLKENRLVILNARVTNHRNNFTFVSPLGCSVPDYLFTPVKSLSNCKELRVMLISDVINYHNMAPPKRMPDHSILRGIFCTSFYGFKAEQPLKVLNLANGLNTPVKKIKKNIKKMPSDFFMSSEIRDQIDSTIERIERCELNQNDVNSSWEEIKGLFFQRNGQSS